MARSIKEIQKTILEAKDQAVELSTLEILTDEEITLIDVDSTSKAANWRLWVWIYAFAQFIQEQYWDTFKKEMEKRIAETRIHTPKWYREKALDFMFGVPLVPETDYYDLSGLTDAQIKAAKIVSNAATVRIVQNGYGTLRLKVVRTVNGEYAPLLPEQINALDIYFNKNVADAGTVVNVTSGNADLLKLKIDIYYDPLVMAADGSRLDGTEQTPVINQIKNYLKSIDFQNGKLVLTYLVDKLQEVPGVILPVIKEAFSKYGDYDYTTPDIQNLGAINEIRIADSGYMKLDELNLLINYIPYSENG
ncbi:hypothetical protein [Flavobacterium covae]|uniref:hypothetical protein n=1 Tax=Flavobacterium covae TaxID=2906076 RepID=UPI000745EAB9|nr:hypothetical protein [Flavobacterium covae]AMA48998.1 hypothetical protein AWN65_05725 [Flavobacterium covae]MCJ1809917.1 hypothetical protein [Flavobacterium covae]